MTEKEKMVSALPYSANDPELVSLRRDVRIKLAAYNNAAYEANDISTKLTGILGTTGKGSWIEPPFYCDYGFKGWKRLLYEF